MAPTQYPPDIIYNKIQGLDHPRPIGKMGEKVARCIVDRNPIYDYTNEHRDPYQKYKIGKYTFKSKLSHLPNFLPIILSPFFIFLTSID